MDSTAIVIGLISAARATRCSGMAHRTGAPADIGTGDSWAEAIRTKPRWSRPTMGACLHRPGCPHGIAVELVLAFSSALSTEGSSGRLPGPDSGSSLEEGALRGATNPMRPSRRWSYPPGGPSPGRNRSEESAEVGVSGPPPPTPALAYTCTEASGGRWAPPFEAGPEGFAEGCIHPPSKARGRASPGAAALRRCGAGWSRRTRSRASLAWPAASCSPAGQPPLAAAGAPGCARAPASSSKSSG